MPNPAFPAHTPEPDDSASYDAAAASVKQVITWYKHQILAERRTPGADPERLGRLVAEQQQCLRDQAQLDAEPGEVARAGARYAARLKELEATGR